MIAALYLIVYPFILYLTPPDNKEPAIRKQFQILYNTIMQYRVENAEAYFSSRSELDNYGTHHPAYLNNIAFVQHETWPKDEQNAIIAVSKRLRSIPCPASLGIPFNIPGWPLIDIPERELVLFANGNIITNILPNAPTAK